MTISLHQALTIYNWFLAAILILMLLMIARFYQRRTQERTFYQGFGLPVILFGLAAIRTAYLDQLANDNWATLCSASGGLILIGLSTYLFRLMIHRR